MLPRVWTPAQGSPARAVRSIPENAPEGPTRSSLVRVQVGKRLNSSASATPAEAIFVSGGDLRMKSPRVTPSWPRWAGHYCVMRISTVTKAGTLEVPFLHGSSRQFLLQGKSTSNLSTKPTRLLPESSLKSSRLFTAIARLPHALLTWRQLPDHRAHTRPNRRHSWG